MKAFLLVFLTLTASMSFAKTSIDKCVDDALMSARVSLMTNENLDSGKLDNEEKNMLINDDAQYLRTRKELELFCRRLWIATEDLAY